MWTTFGGSERFYDGKGRPAAREAKPEVIEFIESILPPDARQSVEGVYKAHNQAIRAHLRDETALDMVQGESRRSVSVEISDDVPPPLLAILESIPKGLLRLFLRRRDVAIAEEIVSLVVASTSAIAAWKPPLAMDEVLHTEHRHVGDYLGKLRAALDDKDLAASILRIDGDVFGAYFYRQNRVELYWIAIALFSGLRGLRTEDLAMVVLTHELAHAYTHLGADVDGDRWDTDAFAQSHPCVVEGLAQFYTDAVATSFRDRFPGVRTVFDALLEEQEVAYTCFRDWGRIAPGNAGEPVRAAMIEARRGAESEYGTFIHRVEEAAVRLHRSKVRGKPR